MKITRQYLNRVGVQVRKNIVLLSSGWLAIAATLDPTQTDKSTMKAGRGTVGRGSNLGCSLPAVGRTARRQVLYAVLVERDDILRSREFVSRAALANDGRAGSVEWDAAVRAHHRLSVRDDPGGLAARQQNGSPAPLIPVQPRMRVE